MNHVFWGHNCEGWKSPTLFQSESGGVGGEKVSCKGLVKPAEVARLQRERQQR